MGDAQVQPRSLGALFAKREDPYANVDHKRVRTWAGGLFVIQSALLLALSPLTPPDGRFGSIGWVLLGAIIAGQLLAAWVLLRRGHRVSDNQLLGLSYLAVAALAVLIWFSHDQEAGYRSIFLLWVVYVPAANPPRRAAAFICFVVLASSAPLLYGGWDRVAAAALLGRMVVWLVLSVMVFFLVSTFRQQRVGLRRRGEAAVRLAVTDPLTGMANRRAFSEVLDQEVERAERSKAPLTLVFADLDGFKEINDRHGHIQGDIYLQRVAQTMRAMLRDQDLGFRWGGDEFAILLPGTSKEDAQAACERLGGVVTSALAETDGIELSLSFGLGEHSPGMSADDLVSAADVDLMSTKPAAGAGAS
jgi:diguanylate cyclase (GGDEF)-like protein